MGVRQLSRPIRRRVGRLVVTITADGVELRGYRRRRLRRFLSWAQIASLSDAAVQPLLAGDEASIGSAELLALKADPAAIVEPKAQAPTTFDVCPYCNKPTKQDATSYRCDACMGLWLKPAAIAAEVDASDIGRGEPIAAADEPPPVRSANMPLDDYWACACVKGKGAKLKIKLNHKSRKSCRTCKTTRPEQMEGAHNV